jgi:hypothetical protein
MLLRFSVNKFRSQTNFTTPEALLEGMAGHVRDSIAP